MHKSRADVLFTIKNNKNKHSRSPQLAGENFIQEDHRALNENEATLAGLAGTHLI